MTGFNPTRRSVTTAIAAGLLPIPRVLADEPRRGGTLTWTLSPDPPGLLSAINATLQIGMVSSKIMESLLGLDLDFKPYPKLATSWTISPDGLTYTFKLRPNVTWHDGKPFTSADVSFSLLEAWRQLHPRGRTSFAKVTGVDTPDPLTVVIRLSEPTPQMLTALASNYETQVIPRHIFEGKDIPTNPAVNAPIGTGPFMFKEWQRGSFILLERNPTYWDEGKPYLDRIAYRIINDASARAAALESGEAQIGGLSPVALTDMARFESNPAFTVETRGYAYMSPNYFLDFNLRRAPLNDLRVRQAIAHAIDRERLTQLVWRGYGKAAVSAVPSTVPAFHVADVPLYELNLDKAKQLLDEAGLPAGAGGRRFKITQDFFPGGSEYQRTAEFIKQQLGRIGIEVETRAQDLPSFLRRVYTEYDFDVSSLYYGAFSDPTQGLQRLFWSKGISKGVASTNCTDYRSPEMDRLLESAQIENDPVKRKALYRDMQLLEMKDLPSLPLMEMRFITVASAKLRNHTITPEGLIGGSFATAYLAA